MYLLRLDCDFLRDARISSHLVSRLGARKATDAHLRALLPRIAGVQGQVCVSRVNSSGPFPPVKWRATGPRPVDPVLLFEICRRR